MAPDDGKGEFMDNLSVSTQRIATAAAGVGDVGTSLAREIATMHELLGRIRAGSPARHRRGSPPRWRAISRMPVR